MENTLRRRHVLGYILCLGVVLVKIFLKSRGQKKYKNVLIEQHHEKNEKTTK